MESVSDGVCATVSSPDPDGLLDIEHEDLPVTDAAGSRGFGDRLDDIVDEAVLDDDLDLHLGEEVDDIFGAAIELGMALLPAEAPSPPSR